MMRTIPFATPVPPLAIAPPQRRFSLPFLVMLGVCILCVLFAAGTSVFAFSRPLPKAVTATKALPATHVPTVAPKPNGNVWFYNVRGQDDGVALHVSALPKLASGTVYILWLINPLRPDQFLAVGPITPDTHGEALLQSDRLQTFNTQAQNLRHIFTHVSITVETSGAQWVRPTGTSLLQGVLDSKTLTAMAPLFTRSPYTPKQIALLSGLHTQTHELARWLANMLDAQAHNDAGNVRLDLSRFLYLLEGSRGVDVARLKLLSQQNVASVGNGLGLLSPNEAACQQDPPSCGYLDLIQASVQTLLSQHMGAQISAQHVLTALTTMRQLAQSIQQGTNSLIVLSKLDALTLQKLTMLEGQIDAFLNGSDVNGDGAIDAVPDEAATAQLFGYVQQLGAIRLS